MQRRRLGRNRRHESARSFIFNEKQTGGALPLRPVSGGAAGGTRSLSTSKTDAGGFDEGTQRGLEAWSGGGGLWGIRVQRGAAAAIIFIIIFTAGKRQYGKQRMSHVGVMLTPPPHPRWAFPEPRKFHTRVRNPSQHPRGRGGGLTPPSEPLLAEPIT